MERYESLTGLASLVAGGGALSETLHAAARHVTEVLGAAWCDIYDYEVRSDEFVVAAYYHAPDVELDTSTWLGTRYDA